MTWSRVRDRLTSDRVIWVYIFLLALLPRLAPSWQFMDPDSAAFWLSRIKEFADGLSGAGIAHLAPALHPGVPLLWLTAPVELLHRATGPWHFMHGDAVASYLTALKFPVALCTSLLAGLTWWLAKQALPRRIAVWFAIFFALDPLYLVYSRYIHLDALVTGFSMAGLLALWLASEKKSRRHFFFGLMLLTLAGLTRINGFFMLGFGGLMWLMSQHSKNLRRDIWMACGTVILTAVIVWPPLLFAPSRIFHLQEAGLGLILGPHEVSPNVDITGPIRSLLYPLFIVTREYTTTIILALIGLWYILKNFRRPEMRFSGWLLLFGFFYFISLLLEPKKLDRYALPLIIPLSLYAAYGWDWLWSGGKKWVARTRVVLIIVILVQVILLWRLAPYYQTYENVFGRVLQHTPLRTSQAFNPAWGEGMSEAADYLRLPDGTLPSLASWYASDFCVYGLPQSMTRYPLSPIASIECPQKIWLLADPTEAEWLVLSRDQVSQRIYPKLLDDMARRGWQPTKTISLNGIPYVWIYKNLGGLQAHYTLSGK